MRALISLALVVALAAVGWTLGGQYFVSDPDTGQKVGAFTGTVFGLLIFFAARTQS